MDIKSQIIKEKDGKIHVENLKVLLAKNFNESQNYNDKLSTSLNIKEGVTIWDMGHKIGINGIDNASIGFNNVKISKDCLLGDTSNIDSNGIFKSKINKDAEFTFTIPGIYAYWCTPHKTMGMIGFVIVGDDLSNLDSIKKVKFGGKSKKIAKGLIAEIEG